MKHITLACAWVAISALSGCAAPQKGTSEHTAIQNTINSVGALLGGKPAATPGAPATPAPQAQGGQMVLINGINIMVDGPRPTDARWAGKRINETPLNRFFEAHPIRRPGDYWPRIGIRVDDYSESLLSDSNLKHTNQLSGSMVANVARPLECIKFTAMVWMSEKQSQRIDGVVHCNSDIKSGESVLSTGALRMYRTVMAPISISSEQVRTLGPRMPAKLLPDTTQDDSALYSNGQHLFSSLFTQLGYRGPLDGDQRLWFVNLAVVSR